MEIRVAEERDLPVIKKMMREFVDFLNAIDEPEEVPDAVIDRIGSLVFGKGAPCTILISETGTMPAGYLSYFWGLSLEGVAPALFIGDLFVSAPYRRLGVGRALMKRAREIAIAAGAAQVNWTVWRKNHAAQAFYLGLGARICDEELLMTWPTDPDIATTDP